MSVETKKSYGTTVALLAFGVLALYGGVNWLFVLVPAAVLVWYAASSAPVGRSRN